MYILRRFAGPRFDRVNSLIDAHFGLLRRYIHLVASGSYPFPSCMLAMSVPFQIFPCEGLPSGRFHPGTEVLDQLENGAEEMIRTLFGLNRDYRATIQPHACTQANQIAFNAVLRPDDRVMSLRPNHGGHISHTVLIGRRNEVLHYGVGVDGRIDYDQLESEAKRFQPALIVSGASSYPREIDWSRIRAICDKIGSRLLADISHTALYLMTGLHSRVFPHADFATFSMSKTLRGPSSGVLIYRSDFRKEVARALFPGTQGGPQQNVLFAKYVALEELLRTDRHLLARQTVANARTMCQHFTKRGFDIITGGTDLHQVMIDLTSTEATGLEAERRCEEAGILVNRNLIPGDRRGPLTTSGLRLGTAAVSILGCDTSDLQLLSDAVSDLVLTGTTDLAPQLDEFRAHYHQRFNAAIEEAIQEGV